MCVDIICQLETMHRIDDLATYTLLLSFAAILAGVFPPAFPLKFQQKDMRQALSLADQVEQPLPITAAVNEVCSS